MDNECDLFEEYLRKRNGELIENDRCSFEEHIVNCAACCAQFTAEKALDDLFSEIPLPKLSPSFDLKLRRRLGEESEKRSRRPLLMQAYWLTVCLVSLFIFNNTRSNIPNIGVATAWFFLCFAVPTVLLGRTLRYNLLDLIFSTLNPPDKRVGSFQNGHGDDIA